MTQTQRCKLIIHGYMYFVYITSIVLSLPLCCRCKRTLLVKLLSCCLSSLYSPLVELFTLVMGLDYCCVTLVPSSETQGQLVGWKGFSWARIYRLTAPGSPGCFSS